MIQYFFHLFDRFFVSNEIYYTTCKNSLKSRFFQVFFINCQILSFSKIPYLMAILEKVTVVCYLLKIIYKCLGCKIMLKLVLNIVIYKT